MVRGSDTGRRSGGDNTIAASVVDSAAATLTERGPPILGEPAWPGRQFGRYQLSRVVGSGGMGTVYAAWDPHLDRQVALKMLHPDAYGQSQGHEVLQEARALARVNHPNVLTVTDVGEHQGRMFLAMELVDGSDVRRWLHESQRDRKQILDVYDQAAQGLIAAHAAGIIHRDFKPANLLLDRSGRVRVMDFGLARVQSSPTVERVMGSSNGPAPGEHTLRGSVSGTPAYMAPEQHLCRPIDERADQFAFCVALYEALYGERPFGGTNAVEIAMNVTTGEVRPEPRGASIPGAIRAVLLRGLQRDPAKRFENMAALRAALSRASRPKRGRWFIGAMVIGALGSGAFVVAADDPEPEPTCSAADFEASIAFARSTDQLRSAMGGKADTWTKIDRRLGNYATDWSSVRFAACRALVHGNGVDVDEEIQCLEEQRRALSALLDPDTTTQADALLKALVDFPSVDRCSKGAPSKESLQAAALRQELESAEALRSLGDYEQAERLAAEVATRAKAQEAESVRIDANLLLGDLLERRGALDESEKARREAYFAAVELEDHDRAASAAIALVSLVGVDLSRPQDARQWVEHARASMALAPSTEKDADFATNLGSFLKAQGKYDEARDELHKALELRVKELGDDHLTVASARNNLANVLMRLNRLDEALELYERAIEVRRSKLGARHPKVARALVGRGGTQYAMGKAKDAIESYSEAIEIFRAALGPDDISLGRVLNNRGELHGALGHYDDSIADLEAAIVIFEKALGTEAREVALAVDNLGMTLLDKGDYDGAVKHHQRALAVLESIHGRSHPSVADVLNNLGNAQDYAGDRARARVSYESSLEILDELDVPSIRKAGPISNLGTLCYAQGDYECALRRTREALELREKHLGADHPDVVISLVNLGAMLSDRLEPGDLEEARKLLERALRTGEATWGANSVGVGKILLSLAFVDGRLGQWDPAHTNLQRAVEVFDAAGAAPEARAQARFNLAKAQWGVGLREEARSNAQSALATFEAHGLQAWLPEVRAWLENPKAEL